MLVWVGPILIPFSIALENLSSEQIFALSDEERAAAAKAFKARGNEAYNVKDFTLAAEYYTKAIEVTPEAEPVFYSNRAACYMNVSPPDHLKVVEDCDHALKLDPRYVKAVNRRGNALENLHRYEESLRGMIP